MKKLLITLLFFPLFSFAGEKLTREMYCDDTTSVYQILKDTYQERVLIVGKADDVAESLMSFWINPLTKSWTILATKGDLTCIVGTGSSFELISVRKQTTI